MDAAGRRDDAVSLSRRRFLALSGGVVGGAVLLAACGSSGDSSSSHNSTTTAGDAELAPAVMSSDLYARPEPQRFAFALLSKDGYASGRPATLAVAPRPTTPTTFAPTTLVTQGLPPKRGIYVSDVVFDKPGIWNGIVDHEGQKLTLVVQVNKTAAAPVVGTRAPAVASPTPAHPLGMNPICTRVPMCSLHSRSLDTLIGKGRPVAVLFATPARCQSQYCGPVLDALLPLVDTYKDRVDIVHCDIYLNNRSDQVQPTVAAWKLPSEPWLYGVDAQGVITARIDGAMGQDEIRQVLESLATGA